MTRDDTEAKEETRQLIEFPVRFRSSILLRKSLQSRKRDSYWYLQFDFDTHSYDTEKESAKYSATNV
jgi:hypothetical protein